LTDSPAGVKQVFHYAMPPADEILVVTNAEVAAARAANRGRPLALARNSSKAYHAFRNIAGRMMGEDVPFQRLRDPGVLERILRLVGLERS
jgi:septum formation inhibitor-activating ATPase MinD